MPSSRPFARALLLLFSLVVAISCSDSQRPVSPASDEPASAPAQVTSQVPFDLGTVMRQTRLAWRATEHEGEWHGGHAGYAAVASRERLSITPLARGQRDGAHARSAVTIETSALGRGPLAPPARQTVTLEPDGHLAIGRGPAVERLHNTEEGVHQSFRFDREPAGAGDLQVRIRVTGAEHTGQTPAGHHFRDAARGVDVLYGKATWVDANGVETAMEVTHAGGGELALIVPEQLLRSSAYPAEIDPIISTQISLSQPVPGYARNNQDQPAAAFDGSNYLVVWQDSRAIDENYSKVYGARVSAQGVLLDPGGIEIFTSGPGGRPPAVAFDGTNYMVAIVDNNGTLRVNRVSPSGAVLDGGSGKTIGSTSAYVQEVSIAFGNTTYLVVWSTHTFGGADIMGRIVDKNGVGVGAAFIISNAAGSQTLPRLAFDGTNYLVAWEDRRSFSIDIYAARVSAAGTLLDPAGIPITTVIGDQTVPSVAFDGTNYLVAWQTETSSSTDVLAARLDTSGVLLDTTPIAVSPVPGTDSTPRVAFDGQSFVVLWGRYVSAFGATYDVYANRVSSAGAVLDGAGTIVSATTGQQQKPFAVCAGAGCLAVWEDGRGGSTDVFAARIAAGAPVEPNGIHVSNAAAEQTTPSVAFGHGVYFVVWQDRGAGSDWNIYGARVATDGTVLDPAGIAISQTPYDQLDPVVAASASGFLVAWQDLRNSASATSYTDVYASRVTPAGVVLDPNGIALTSDQHDDDTPTVASDGTDYLVAWHDAYGPGVNDRIHATRVTAAGVVLDPTPIQPIVSGGDNPAVTFGAGQYFLVWGGSNGSRGARLTPAGTVLDAAPGISLSVGGYPAVAFDGQSYVVAARAYTGSVYQMYARRVSPAGAVLDATSILLSTQPGANFSSAWYRLGPSVAFDGIDSIITWNAGPGSFSVQGAWLSPAGVVIGSGTLVTSSVAAMHSTAIASEGDGHHSLVTYAFGDPAPGIKQYRAKANIVTAKTNGEGCTLDAECKSAYCVDGVCCKTSCGGNSQTDCQACSVAAGAPTDGTCAPISGTPCSDGNACTQNDMCSNGTCTAGTPVTCTAIDSCHNAGVCQPATGLCTNPNKANGAACNDSNACTQTDTCQAGSCVGASPVTCAPPDACHQAGTCVPATGTCDYAPKADGTACSDGSACTTGDTCQAGACTAGTTVTCAPPDACHQAGVCNPTNGQCTYENQPNGTGCDDGNPCTQTDLCQAGACVGQSPVACPAPNACMNQGTCDATTGQCVFVPKADGTACDDGDKCTLSDACQAGSCVAGAPKTCPAPAACHEAGTCDPATGQCDSPPSADGTACDDDNACTQTDTCKSGACVGASPVVCTAEDECHKAGTCAPSTGQCSNPKQPNGTPCSLGICSTGVCTPEGTGGSGGSGTGGGGEGGTGTTTGTGGTHAGGAGGAGAGGSAGQSSSSSSGGATPPADGGCGCRTAPQDSTSGGVAMLLALGLLARRRQARSTRA